MKQIRTRVRHLVDTQRTQLPFHARSVGHKWLDPYETRNREAGDFVEIYWGIAGSGEFSIPGGEAVLVGPNEVFSYQPNVPHHFRAGPKGFEFRHWTIDGPLAAATVAGFGILPPWPRRVGPAPAKLFDRMYELLTDVRVEAEREASGVAYQLLLAAAQPGGVAAECSTVPDALIRASLRILYEEFTNSSFGIEAIADRLRVDRTVLSRRFHKATGFSPRRYLMGLRLQKALHLLKETGDSITAIARQSGFSSLCYFSRAIRASTGLSPTEYRRF